MKLVREHINEKFTEDSDPINDLGIGVCGPHTFSDVDEFVDYVIEKVLPHLYGSIPDDILSKKEKGVMPNHYYYALVNFFKKYGYKANDNEKIYDNFDVNYAPNFSCWVINLKNKLLKLGYKE